MDLRQVADDLLREIVMQLVAGPGEPANERPRLRRRSLAEGGLDECEGSGPAFRPLRELSEDVGLQRSTIGLAEELLELAVREPKLGDPEVGDLAQGTELGHRDRGLASTREHDRQSL